MVTILSREAEILTNLHYWFKVTEG